jgi:RecA/RadA recombinase
MCEETMRYLRDTIGAELVKVNTDAMFPVRHADDFKRDLVVSVEDALKTKTSKKEKLCSFSHIPFAVF